MVGGFRLGDVDLIGRSHYQVFPQLGEEWQRVYENAMAGSPQRCDEDLWVRADGSQDWVRWEVSPWADSGGAVRGITVTCEIVNKQMGKRESSFEQVGRSLMLGQATPIVSLSLKGQIEEASNGCNSLASNTNQLEGAYFWDAFSLEGSRQRIRDEFLASAHRTIELEHFAFPQTIVDTVQLSSGISSNVAWSTSPRYDESGKIAGVICIGALLGDEKRLNDQIAKVNGKSASSQSLMDQVPFGIIMVNQDRNVVYANPEHRNLLGYDVTDYGTVEEWLRHAIPDPLQAPAIISSWREKVWREMNPEILTLRTREKVLREVEFRPRVLGDGGVVLTIFDVTEQRREEKLLQSSELRYRSLFEEAGVGIALEDYSGNFFDVNARFSSLVGASREEIRDSGTYDWIHRDDWPIAATYLQQLELGDPSHRPRPP